MTRNKIIKDWVDYETPLGVVQFSTGEVFSSINASAGFDSWVMFYLYCNALDQVGNYDIHIHPVHNIKINSTGDKKYNRKNTTDLANFQINWMRKKFPNLKNIQDPLITYSDYWWIKYPIWNDIHCKFAVDLNMSVYQIMQVGMEKYKNEFNNEYVNKNRIFANLQGSNLTPDADGKILGEPSVIAYRSKKEEKNLTPHPKSVSYWEGWYKIDNITKWDHKPFRNVDKRIIYWLADKFGILDFVEEHAWTCEGNSVSNKNFTVPCNLCWQCKERNWARETFRNL